MNSRGKLLRKPSFNECVLSLGLKCESQEEKNDNLPSAMADAQRDGGSSRMRQVGQRVVRVSVVGQQLQAHAVGSRKSRVPTTTTCRILGPSLHLFGRFLTRSLAPKLMENRFLSMT